MRACPICRSRFLRFEKTYAWANDRGVCPKCGSRQRHRHLWLYLETQTDLLNGGARRLLHFAPERGLRARLSAAPDIDYVSVDIEPGRADRVADIQCLPFDSDEFDVVLCVHVLEHIPDDAAALLELRRVLRPGGWAVLQVPVQGLVTQEDPAVVSPEDRQRLYGQHDHVRMYGRDVADRIRSAGFDVRVDLFRDQMSSRKRRWYGLDYDLPFSVDYNDIPEPWEVYLAVRPSD